MAVKEIIYLTVKHVLCDGDKEKTFQYITKYLDCPKTKISINKTVYAVSRLLQKVNSEVDFGYYWGVCGPYSAYVHAKIEEWIIPGLNDAREELSEKMRSMGVEGHKDPPLREYYEKLAVRADGMWLFDTVKDFFALSEDEKEQSYRYFELLASALDLYTPGDTEEFILERLALLKSMEQESNDILMKATQLFFERKDVFFQDRASVA
ncbi:MAG: hypothetical protein LBH09_00210 [Peptococcaceae bacterium]|jgi:hypothetical protein|nr:hypothetical protein [Peptococcaceae bacterium]